MLKLLRSLSLPERGKIADFGCSNGFILSCLRDSGFSQDAWEMSGFDHAPHYIEAARRRQLPRASFEVFDLDAAGAEVPGRFQLVLCLETLEHTGNYRCGLRKVMEATAPGGWLMVSVPNERGIPGLLKFAGRRLLRKTDYRGFFRGQSAKPYVWALLKGSNLEAFLQPPRHGWADHLGFDFLAFERVLKTEAMHCGLDLVATHYPAMGFGRLYLLRRQPSEAHP